MRRFRAAVVLHRNLFPWVASAPRGLEMGSDRHLYVGTLGPSLGVRRQPGCAHPDEGG
jgi:hypothetical protein